MLCYRKILVEKKFMDEREGEVSRLLSKISGLTLPKIFVGNPSVFPKFQVSKKFLPMSGISRFTIEKMLSHGPEKLRGGSLLCFTIFLVSKKFMDKRGGGRDGGREGVSRSSVKNFLSHSAKNFKVEPFCAVFRKVSGSESVYG